MRIIDKHAGDIDFRPDVGGRRLDRRRGFGTGARPWEIGSPTALASGTTRLIDIVLPSQIILEPKDRENKILTPCSEHRLHGNCQPGARVCRTTCRDRSSLRLTSRRMERLREELTHSGIAEAVSYTDSHTKCPKRWHWIAWLVGVSRDALQSSKAKVRVA
mmetsp:Transcript_91973/g.297542  ORF Transcript_91973/g.297542 Transcript_91973/m.297542 type:complete len:161 (-) Transcript_91973:51-533(-)